MNAQEKLKDACKAYDKAWKTHGDASEVWDAACEAWHDAQETQNLARKVHADTFKEKRT